MVTLRRPLGILAHKNFVRDVPTALLPGVHACLRKLRTIDKNRWHGAGVRVKKLEGFAYPVFEARLNRGDRLIFTLNPAESDALEGLHVLLWYAGPHDDAVRTAGRRMGVSEPVMEDLFDLAAVDDALGLTWDGLRRLGGVEVLAGAPIARTSAAIDPFSPFLRAAGSLVELAEPDIDRWAESQIDPILHLTPEQRALTRAGEDQPIFLRGGVGTGKTTVALYRMLKLLMAGSITRPAFLTYSRTLAGWCQSVFERLPGWEQFHVEFTSLSGLLRGQFGRAEGGKRLFKRVWSQRGLAGDPGAAWRDLRRLRGSAAFRGRQPRTGEDLPDFVDASLKTGYTAYRKQLGRACDVLDLAWKAYEHFLSPAVSANLPYDAIFIDEAQDLTPIEWLVCILMGNRPRLAFFCADEAQDILDTRFSWDGVEAAMQLVGHRAPTFSCVDLQGNQRNSSPIAALLEKISERFDLLTSSESSASRPGPTPLVCVGTIDHLEKAARQAGCPVLLDLAARSDRDCGEFFWSLDLDHIKGLEFQVLPLLVPRSVWPTDKHLARKLYTAVSRALQVLVIFTDDATARSLEELGAQRVASQAEIAEALTAHRDLIAWDREAMARWKVLDYGKAVKWVDGGICTWKDFRPQLARWSSEVPYSIACHWVQEGLCTWELLQDRMGDWVGVVPPELAADWVREGLCLAEDFARRAPGWVQAADLRQATTWVEAGLVGWEDFRFRIPLWISAAPLPMAAAWVETGVCSWSDFQVRLQSWVPEVSLAQAQAWVASGAVSWDELRTRVPDWYSSATIDAASAWVRLGLCTWHDVRAQIPSWAGSVSLDCAVAWVDAELSTWVQLRHRLPEWVEDASFEHASAWVEAGLCGWNDFGDRVEPWVSRATPEQSLAWLDAGLCSPKSLWERIPSWRSAVTLSQATVLVEAGACSWGAFAPRLAGWGEDASCDQAREWVGAGLRAWRDFEARIPSWIPSASLELATSWVSEGLCSWRDFEPRIAEWMPLASLDHACDWVDAGLASWEDFKLNLPRWAESAPAWRVARWRDLNLISRQLARAAMRRGSR